MEGDCGAWCCVAKRYDRPFRLPASSSSPALPSPASAARKTPATAAPAAAAISPGGGGGDGGNGSGVGSWSDNLGGNGLGNLLLLRRDSRPDELAEDAPSVYELVGAAQLQRHSAPVHNQARVAADVKEEEGQQAEGQLQEQKEGEEDAEDAVEDAAARVTLREILSVLQLAQGARGGGGSGGDGGGGGDSSGSGGSDGCDDGAKSFAKEHLSTIAHLTHRRERYCRVLLQHPAADVLVNYIADVLARGASRVAFLAAS